MRASFLFKKLRVPRASRHLQSLGASKSRETRHTLDYVFLLSLMSHVWSKCRNGHGWLLGKALQLPMFEK